MGPAPFLMKMYGMVDDDRTDGVISWAEKGTSFVVWEPLRFSRDLLPAHFKHNNFSSFVRQLNTYGFRKLTAERWEFANDNFRRGEEALLSYIRRRKAPSATESAVQNDQRCLKKRLSDENRNLRRENETLGTELARAKQHCKRLLVSLSRHIEVSQLDDLMPLLVSQGGEGGEALREEEGEGNCNLKLFGVLLKCNSAKRMVEADNDRRRLLGS